MIYLIVLLAVGWLYDRLYLTAQITHWRGETHAAETDLRNAQQPTVRPRRGTPEPPRSLIAPPVFALGAITAPVNRDLYAWITATDDMPALCAGRPRLDGEPDTCLGVAA